MLNIPEFGVKRLDGDDEGCGDRIKLAKVCGDGVHGVVPSAVAYPLPLLNGWAGNGGVSRPVQKEPAARRLPAIGHP